MTVITGQTGQQAVTVGSMLVGIRQYLATSSPNAPTDAQLIRDLNVVWQQQIPSGDSYFGLQDTWIFTTQPGQDSYQFPLGQILTIVDGLFLVDQVVGTIINADNKTAFYAKMASRAFPLIFRFLNGSTGPFTHTVGGKIARGYQNLLGVFEPQAQISFFDSTGKVHELIDNGDGNLYYEDPIGTFTPYGTINYLEGKVDFATPLPAYGSIKFNYDASSWAKPATALFCNNVLTLRPIPNEAYRIVVYVAFQPNPFTSVSDVLPFPIYEDFLIKATALRIVKRAFDERSSLFLSQEVQEAIDKILNVNARNRTVSNFTNQFSTYPTTVRNYNGVFANPYPYV